MSHGIVLDKIARWQFFDADGESIGHRAYSAMRGEAVPIDLGEILAICPFR